MVKWLYRASSWLHPSEGLLGAYADGELGESDSDGVSRHLLKCGQCKAIVEARWDALRLVSSLQFDPEKRVIDEMLADGRAELARRLGGEWQVPSAVDSVGASESEAAEAIFGCRIPLANPAGTEGSGSSAERRLDQMCAAMLGSRVAGPNAR
jgi:anti-sigma factor RsiW